MLIKDTAQRVRALAPNKYGLSPAVAERLQSLGIDPEAHALSIRAGYATRERQAKQGPIALSLPSGTLALTLDPGDVTTTTVLNETAMLWRNGELVADEVCPAQLVDDRSSRYNLWGREEMRLPVDDVMGPHSEAKVVEPSLSNDNYSVVDRALVGAMSRTTQNANPTLGARARSVENVMERLMLGREIRVADKLLTSGNYGGSNSVSLGATRKWNGGSTATPLTDMHTAMEAIPAQITHAVMSDQVWHAAVENADIKAIVASQLNNKGLLTPMDFALYFGIANVLISKAYKQSKAGTVSRVWGSSAIVLLHVNPAPNMLTFARTFRWNPVGSARGFTTMSWFEPKKGPQGSDMHQVSYADDEKIVANDFGYLMAGVKQ